MISLPNVLFEIGQQGPKYSDLIDVNSDGVTNINISNALAAVKDQNYYSTFLNLGSIGIGMNIKKSTFSLSHSVKLLAYLEYPGEFVELYANGNAAFIGQTISIGPDFQLSLYNELALGYSYGNDHFRIGGRIKYLSGIEDVSVANDKISLRTSDDIYQLQFNNDYLINTSSLLRIGDLSDITFEFDGMDVFNFFGSNRGLALDLGGELILKNKKLISFSILNIGRINWSSNVTNYSSSGEIVFGGIDIVDIIRDTSEILLVDSLYNILQFQESNNEYSSNLPLKVYLNYSHYPSSRLQLSYLYFLQFFRGNSIHALALNANFSIGNAFLFGMNYLIRSDAVFNLGLQATLKFGPLQLYANTGNLPGLFDPKSYSFTSGRVGLNLQF